MGAGDGIGRRALSPAELAVRELARTSRDPSIIVRAALSDHMAFKDAALSLAACEPNADAARALVDAHDRGEAESWLVACLLGHVRHPAGYAKLIEILDRADRSSATHAARGLVMIAGADAEPDLARAIDTHGDEEVRAAVALALANLGTPSALAFLLAAPARGRLEGRTLGRALVHVHVQPEAMIAALRSDDRETKRWPTVTIAKRIARRDRDRCARELAVAFASTELRAALRAVLDEPGDLVWHTHATAIRAWLDSG